MSTLYPDIVGLNQTVPKEKASAPPPSMLSPPNQQLATPKSSPEWPSRLSPESESPSEQILACHWAGCSSVFDNAETLYTHLCDDHVGRKSTKNLTLTCKWDSCEVTTAKRDHITSHIRIHIPLKPYKCNLCVKSFKRPQDLKKHARTHQVDALPNTSRYADQEVKPHVDHRSAQPMGQVMPMHPHTGYAPPPTAPYGTYGAGVPMEPYGGVPAPLYGNYGPSPYYGNDTLSGMVRSSQPYEESRKRALDMTYDLISDVKRSRVAPSYSSQMAQRINAMSPLVQGPVPTAQDVNRFANLPMRDLNSADDFLNQLSMNLSRNSDLFGYSPPGSGTSLPSPEEASQAPLYPSLPWDKQSQSSQIPRFDHEATGRRMVVGTQRAAAPARVDKETPREVYDDNALSDDEDGETVNAASPSASPVPVAAEAASPTSTTSSDKESPENAREEALNALRVISVLRNLLSKATEMKRKQEEGLYPAVEVK